MNWLRMNSGVIGVALSVDVAYSRGGSQEPNTSAPVLGERIWKHLYHDEHPEYLRGRNAIEMRFAISNNMSDSRQRSQQHYAVSHLPEVAWQD